MRRREACARRGRPAEIAGASTECPAAILRNRRADWAFVPTARDRVSRTRRFCRRYSKAFIDPEPARPASVLIEPIAFLRKPSFPLGVPAHIIGKNERRIVTFAGRMRLAADFLPLRPIERRKKGIARRGKRDIGHVKPIDAIKQGAENFSPAREDDLRGTECFRPSLAKLKRGLRICYDEDAGGRAESAIARDDDRLAAGQDATEGGERLAPHDDRLAERQCLEMFQIARNMPRQAIVATDHAVLGNRHDGGKRLHEARANSWSAGPTSRQIRQSLIRRAPVDS